MQNLKFILRRFAAYRAFLLCAAGLTAVCCAAEISLPVLMEEIVNRGMLRENLECVRAVGAKMLVAAVTLALAGYGSFLLRSVAAERFSRTLREELYQKITVLSAGQVEELGAGSLAVRLTNDVAVASSMLEGMLQLVLEPALLLAGGVWMMWRISHDFDTVFICFAALQCLLVVLFLRRMLPLFTRLREKNDGLNRALLGKLRSLRLIKACREEARERASFGRNAEGVREAQHRLNRWAALFNPVLLFVVNCAVAVILYLSGCQAREGSLQPGSVLAAVMYAQQVLLSIVASGGLFSHLAEADVSAGRIRHVLDMPPGIVGGERPLPPGSLDTLTLEDVSFRYGEDAAEVFSGLGLSVERGSLTAICGSVGCGKTALARLLGRVCDPASGAVRLNGMDIRDYRLEDVRREIAVVESGMDIVAGDIRHNILYGREDIPGKNLNRAVEASGAGEVIRRLPQGEQTYALSMGVSLSGGDRQRLALARALAGGPGLLVMDDCTSSLDYLTEKKTFRAIRRLYPELAIVFTTQRVFSTWEADTVVCVNRDGRAETGTAEDLMEHSALFRELCRSQGGTYEPTTP